MFCGKASNAAENSMFSAAFFILLKYLQLFLAFFMLAVDRLFRQSEHAKGVHRQSKSRLSAKKNQTGKHTAASLACFLLYGNAAVPYPAATFENDGGAAASSSDINAAVPAYAANLILENQPSLSQSARLPAWLSGKPGIPHRCLSSY